MKKLMDYGAPALCLVITVGGLAVALWVLISGMPGREGIDAMFLLLVGLAFSVFFGAIAVQSLRGLLSKAATRHAAKVEAGRDRANA